jgi:Glycosyltransferases involved in cell wall biogenesis
MTFPKSLVIVPTYNEKENILLMLDAILQQHECLEVLVVDDGSPDGTGDMVAAEAEKNSRIHLIRRKGKMGLGSAYVTGFKWALERDYERVFEMDADFSHSPSDLTRFLEAAEESDLVLGSRYMKQRISVVNWDLVASF